MNIAEKIKAVRRAKGITPTIMARELGIEATNYPRLENRGNRLSYENLEQISRALGITVIELLTWEEDEPLSISKSEKPDLLQNRIKELEKQLDAYRLYADAVTGNHRSLEEIFDSVIYSLGESRLIGDIESDLYEYYNNGEKHQTETYYQHISEKDLFKIFEYIFNVHHQLYTLLLNLVLGGIVNKENRQAKQLLDFNSKAVRRFLGLRRDGSWEGFPVK